MNAARTLIVAAAAVVATACAAVDAFTPNPHAVDELVEGEVRVSLTVAPETVTSPGTVIATLTYENLGNETVVVVSSAGCLSFASVYLGNDPIPFPATQYACTGAFTYWDLAPGVPLTMQWPLVIGGEGGMDVPRGTYRFVARLLTHAPNLERTFVVR